MSLYQIEGGNRLIGTVPVNGSKNSALPIITAAALAAEGESVLENIPSYTDILDLIEILRELGAEAEFIAPKTLRVDGTRLGNHVAPYERAARLRGSTYIVGLLLARMGKAEVAVPGGCDIGARPVDFHLRGFEALGARAWVEHGAIIAETPQGLQGTRFYVERRSHGTTCNLMIAASLAFGTTVLENAAQEPEIVDLANFLNAMGARVRGAGTDTVRIEGVERLKGAHHEVIPDRIEAGTFLLAAAATAGRVTVGPVIPEHLRTMVVKLQGMGAKVDTDFDSITIDAPERLKAVDIQTLPHPGFPTDLQPQAVAALCLADGVSVVEETIFDNRFAYANDLVRLGAQIKIERNTALVRGVGVLTGAPVTANDIRGGAALVIAGLAAQGRTEVAGVRHIERGFEHLEEKLGALGAEIRRVAE